MTGYVRNNNRFKLTIARTVRDEACRRCPTSTSMYLDQVRQVFDHFWVTNKSKKRVLYTRKRLTSVTKSNTWSHV